MRTVREVNNLVELIAYIQSDNEHLTIKNIMWKYYGFDSRIGWKSYVVCAVIERDTPGGGQYSIPTGFANAPLADLTTGVIHDC